MIYLLASLSYSYHAVSVLSVHSFIELLHIQAATDQASDQASDQISKQMSYTTMAQLTYGILTNIVTV